MYGLFMTLALAIFLSTELGELLSLREKVGSLERDIDGLEAIVLNLDSRCRKLDRQCGRLDSRCRKLDRQVVALYDDAASNRPFVPPNGPDEDELASTCIY